MCGRKPSASARATWSRSTWRGDTATGCRLCSSTTSHSTMAVRSIQGTGRSVERSGMQLTSP